MSDIADSFLRLGSVTLAALGNLLLLGVVFTVLPRIAGVCNNAPGWWRKPDLATDLCWALAPNMLYQFSRTVMLIFGIMVFYGMSDPAGIAGFLVGGHGPLAGLGFWPQVAFCLLGSDLVLYSTHRLFHGRRLWRFHAVHHSSRYLEWISATRFHPVDAILHGSLPDVVMLLLGVPAEVLVWLMPFNVGTSAVVHANLDWSYGPFRYLLASPVFHRWHHTSKARGGGSNFAGTFPFIDLIFGTFYMPVGQRPDAYGLDEAGFPGNFFGQMLRPFWPRPRPVARRPAMIPAAPGGSLASGPDEISDPS